MNPYTSVFDIYADNKVLKEQIKQLENEILKLKEINARQDTEITKLQEQNDNLNKEADSINEVNSNEILDYFHSCSSIRKTAWKYEMEMEELYELIPQWEDCRDGLRSASDYQECRIEVIGRREYDEELEEYMEKADLEFKQRIPDSNEVIQIIDDYKKSNLSLYELADRYNLQINNLFRLLKENKVIDRETDTKGYTGFYEEHMGSGCEWDGKSELGLLE